MSRPTGRPANPPELHVLRGHPSHGRPKDRGALGSKPSAVPPAPGHLQAAGKRAWALYWQHGRTWLAMTDIPILTQLCEYHDTRATIAATIKREGLVHLNEDTGRSFTHHLFNDLRGLDSTIREIWSLCHFTPTDRGRANVQPDVTDPLTEWQAQ